MEEKRATRVPTHAAVMLHVSDHSAAHLYSTTRVESEREIYDPENVVFSQTDDSRS